MPQATEEKTSASVLVLPRSSRAFLVGTTGTGKSTLMEVMMKEYQKKYSQEKKQVRTLIIDTKPRFKAKWEMNGFSTELTRRYKKWGYGSGIIQNSHALAGRSSIKTELDEIWSLGSNVAICHTERESEWEYASRVATTFYEGYGAGIPRLLIVDEMADFFKFRSLGDIFQRVARNGRERDCALLCGSQRPRKVPVEVLTEMTRVYMFQLDFIEDLKRVWDFGVPRNTVEPQGHTFFLYDRHLKQREPSNKYYELSLGDISGKSS
jgi:DNA helicase HerA-like ATPase